MTPQLFSMNQLKTINTITIWFEERQVRLFVLVSSWSHLTSIFIHSLSDNMTTRHPKKNARTIIVWTFWTDLDKTFILDDHGARAEDFHTTAPCYAPTRAVPVEPVDPRDSFTPVLLHNNYYLIRPGSGGLSRMNPAEEKVNRLFL